MASENSENEPTIIKDENIVKTTLQQSEHICSTEQPKYENTQTSPKLDTNKQNDSEKKKRRVGIIGYGHLGQFLKIELSKSTEFSLQRIWNRTPDKEEDVFPLNELTPANLSDIDLVIEVSHPDIVRTYSKLILDHADLFIGSQSALADKATSDAVQECLKRHSGRAVYVPSGAFWGIHDIKKMADIGTLKAVTLMFIKHPDAFKVIGSLKELNELAKRQNSPMVIYDGTARLLFSHLDASAGGIKNMVAGCAIAGHSLGFDEIRIKLIADPEMLHWNILEYETLSENGFKTIVRRQTPAQHGASADAGEAVYFSFLSSLRESLHKHPGLNIC